jgi:hypothetical protein
LGLSLASLFPESSRQTRRAREKKASSEDTATVELAERFDVACQNVYRRLRVVYWTTSRVFAGSGLDVTDDEAWWIRDLPYMEFVMELLASDNPEDQYAGLQAVGRWLI